MMSWKYVGHLFWWGVRHYWSILLIIPSYLSLPVLSSLWLFQNFTPGKSPTMCYYCWFQTQQMIWITVSGEKKTHWLPESWLPSHPVLFLKNMRLFILPTYSSSSGSVFNHIHFVLNFQPFPFLDPKPP